MPQREMEGEEDIYLFFVLATGLQLEKKNKDTPKFMNENLQ